MPYVMKIKILHILNSLQIGGLENGVVNLINHLDNCKFEHAICCIESSGPMADRIIPKDVKIYEIKKNGRDYFLPLKLMKLIRQVRPDVVHTRNWATIDGVIGARLAGVKRIVHGEHGREATDPTGANNARKKIRKILNPWIPCFVTVSEDLKRWLINDVGIPSAKVTQIINGVDTGRFRPAADKAAAKAKAGFSPDSFVIGTVGRLDPVKDQKTLIRAFAGLSATDPINEDHYPVTAAMPVSSSGDVGGRVRDVTDLPLMIRASLPLPSPALLIAGSGPEEKNLKGLARELGIADKVYFMGERTDVPEVLQVMDVFVLPSIAEGISNTILEAMACGLPVVATRVGGNAELVDDGKSGVIFRAGDDTGLAATLFSYMDNRSLLEAHGLSARQRAKDLFSLSRMVKAYDKLYRSVVET